MVDRGSLAAAERTEALADQAVVDQTVHVTVPSVTALIIALHRIYSCSGGGTSFMFRQRPSNPNIGILKVNLENGYGNVLRNVWPPLRNATTISIFYRRKAGAQ